MPDEDTKKNLGLKVVRITTLMVVVILIGSAVNWGLTTEPYSRVEDVEYHGVIERLEGGETGDDDFVRVTTSETDAGSVTLYLYDDEGDERASMKHVYTGTTVTIRQDLIPGYPYRLVAVAPNGTVIGSATFTWAEGREKRDG